MSTCNITYTHICTCIKLSMQHYMCLHVFNESLHVCELLHVTNVCTCVYMYYMYYMFVHVLHVYTCITCLYMYVLFVNEGNVNMYMYYTC